MSDYLKTDTLVEILNIFLKDRLLLVLSLSAFLSILLFFILEPKFESSFSAYPFSKSENSQNEIMSIATTYGLLDSNDVTSFYIPDLVYSNFILLKILNKKRVSLDDNNLFDYWEIKDSLITRLSFFLKSFLVKNISYDKFVIEKNLEELKESILITEEYSGLTRIKIVTDDPHLSKELAEEIFNILNEFYNNNNKDKAELTIDYIKKRISDVDKDVKVAENALEKFLENNRQTTSPDLIIEKMSIQNDLNLKYTTFNTLQQQLELELLEMEKIEKYLVLIDKPMLSSTPVSPNRLYTFLSIIFILTSLFIYQIISLKHLRIF